VLIVEKIVKYLSNLTQADLFTVESAIRNVDRQEEDSKLNQEICLASFSSLSFQNTLTQ
jgi:hypothetical protein